MAYPTGRIRATAALVFAFVALFGLLLASAARDARAGFAPGTTAIATGSPNVELGPRPLAVDGAGRTTIVYESGAVGGRVVHARRVAANGIVGPPLTLSDTPAADNGSASVASSPGGRSFAAWDELDNPQTASETESVKGRWIEPNGSLGPVLTLFNGTMSADAVTLEVVIAPDGTATVTWIDQHDSSKLRAIRVSPAGALSAVVPDISGGGVGGSQYQLASLPDGTTLAAWYAIEVKSNTLSPSGTPGTPASLSSGAETAADPGLAVDGHGDGLAAWRVDHSGSPDTYEIAGRRLNSSGAPIGSEFTVDPAASGFAGSKAWVSADSTGHFLVTWDRQDSLSNPVGYARRVDADGTLGVMHPVTAGPGMEIDLVSALQDRGSAAVAWRFLGPGVNDAGGRGRVLDTSGAPIGGVVPLFNITLNVVGAGRPSANVAAFAAVVFESGKSFLRLRRFLSPPICSKSQAKVLQAESVDIHLACHGPGITRVQVTQGPKHGKLGSFDARRGTIRYKPKAKFFGTDRFSYRGVSGGGKSSAVTVTIHVVRDKDRPRITSFTLKKSGTGKKRTLHFVLTYGERATAKVTVLQRVNGHFQAIAVLRSKKPRTSASIRVPSGLAKTLLGGGKFRATAVATDPPGNRSKRKSIPVP